MGSMTWLETLAILLTVLLLSAYHWRLIARLRRAPLQTAIGLAQHVRRIWVASVMRDKRDILAVQTLRNWIMAASLLASTAIVITMGLLNLMASDKVRDLMHTLNVIGAKDSGLWPVKMLVLLVIFFFAFFNFSLAIRYFNHAVFMITLPLGADPEIDVTSVSGALRRGSLHYTLGMRGYYLAIPGMLWLFGPLWMLLGAVALVLALAKLDRPAVAAG